MANDRILFSTQSKLAWHINRQFYKDTHFVWCSTTFDSNTTFDPIFTPPSSTPLEIYRTLARDVLTEDGGSAKIRQNRMGLLKGAKIYRDSGKINSDQYFEVVSMVRRTAFRPFLPVLYLIHYDRVHSRLKSVAVKKRANPMSAEYIIPDLGPDDFVVISP